LLGTDRPSIAAWGGHPRPIQDPFPVWVAVGGTPQSAVRAGSLGLPLALAIIGGMPERFAPFAELHRRAAVKAGHAPPAFSINSHGFIAEDAKEAMDLAYPAFALIMDKIGQERGWPPMTRQQFDGSCSLRGANFVGNPDQIIEKILFQHEIFGHDRFMLQMTVGSLPHDKILKSIELLGTKVAPVVRREIARRKSTDQDEAQHGLSSGPRPGNRIVSAPKVKL